MTRTARRPGNTVSWRKLRSSSISAIRNFTNPFSWVDKDHLYSLASGAPASPEMELDVLHAEAAGKEAKEVFIRDRFANGFSETLFFEPVKRQKLKTMEASNPAHCLTRKGM